MVGKLGCGCCASGCCSDGTTTWIEPFSSTPSGQPYDTIANITGPNCRATCPPPSTTVGLGIQYLKTSTLQIDADSSSPMYLGLNGFPIGGKFTAGWISSTNASQWSVMVPPFILLNNEMGIRVQTELIFKFQTFTFYSGAVHYFTKRVKRNIFGQLVYEYLSSSQGYFRLDNGLNSSETTVLWFLGESPRFLDWNIENLYQPDNTAVGGGKCKQIYEEKKAIENTSGQPLKSLSPPQYIPKGTLPQPPETFQCSVGWKSEGAWYTTAAFGAVGTGSFDFKSEYVSWKPAAWTPYMP